MSSSNAHVSAAKRIYRLGKRAEQQGQTRQRIVEAAVELHSTVGPARASVAQIAARAGVQRHTFYAHFPEERILMQACSSLTLERDPLPNVEHWAEFKAGKKRIRRGLAELYGWYERNEKLTACLLRDAEIHEPTREILGVRMTPTLRRAAQVLGEKLSERARAVLSTALDFHCWRALAKKMSASEGAALMADAIARLDR